MSSLFEPHVAEMAAFCRSKRPDNQCIFGIDSDGKLHLDEVAGAQGHSLIGEWQEQIQFIGGSTKAQIENRVYAR
jgi:hypothetical protein